LYIDLFVGVQRCGREVMGVIAGNRRMEWAKWNLVLNGFTS
jgi:hypothetical protein